MRLGAWVMISPTWGFPPRRRQRWGESRLFSRITRSTRLRETRMPRQTRSRAQTLRCPLALPGGCLQVGLDGHQQSLVRDRGLRSPALCWWALSGGLLPGFHGVERGTGKNPRPHRPAGGRRPNPCRERWRHSSPRPPPPQRAGRLRLGLPAVPPAMINSPIRFMAMSSSAFTGSPLRSLSEASIPAIAFSRHCSSRKISTPNCRDKSSTGSPRKSRRATSRLRVTVHRWPSPRGPAGETWPGENVDEPKLALVYHRPINSNFVLKIVGHVPVLLGHFD